MERKKFTAAELETIRKNQYVKRATSKMIIFTVEFKEEFWRRYKEERQGPRKIIEAMGFEPKILGRKRIEGIARHLREQAESGEAFRDERQRREANQSEEQQTVTKEMMKMRHKIAYMEQELEFIKKSIIADNEARQKQ